MKIHSLSSHPHADGKSGKVFNGPQNVKQMGTSTHMKWLHTARDLKPI